MIDKTVNDAKTVAGDGKDMVLAGRYHILRRLGQGGMGSVWLAEDRQLDNRKVAIKMLPTIVVQDKRAYQQLKGEALVSLKLIHPNIVTLRAFEENNGAPFLVMDYVEGQTLSDYLAVKGKLSEAETIKLLKPIAAALDYAHSEKVIHRDVKPSNIIIRKDGHPVILDFGIAREIQESMTRVTGRTISGTLLYMSPEQLRGAPPAPAQDVYSFAAMAYECINGEPPFIRGEIAHQILNEKPFPLPGGSHFVVSIMAGLAKKPEKRPKSCSAYFDIIDVHTNIWRKRALTAKILICGGFLMLCAFLVYEICQLNGDHKAKGVSVGNDDEWSPGTRTYLSNMVWSYHIDDYYKRSRFERLSEERRKDGKISGWALLFDGGAQWTDRTVSEKAQKEYAKINESLARGEIDIAKNLLQAATCKDNSVYYFLNGSLAEHVNDIKAAYRWYQLAAEDWCKEALFNLGVFYEFGVGVPCDLKLASGYYQRAGLMGDSEARRCYERVSKQKFKIPETGLIPIK